MNSNDWSAGDRPLEEASTSRIPASTQPPPYRPTPMPVAYPASLMTSDTQSPTLLLPFSGGQLPSPASSVNMSHQLPPLPNHPPSHLFFRHPPPGGPSGPYPVFMSGSPATAGIPTPNSRLVSGGRTSVLPAHAPPASPYNARPIGNSRTAPVAHHHAPHPAPPSGRPSQSSSSTLGTAPTASPSSRSRHTTATPSQSRYPTPLATTDSHPAPTGSAGPRSSSHATSRETSARPDVENRRPEYLVRAPRAESPPFDRFVDEPVMPGMGITVSPMKGRRITLFQETSEESFEQSLMAGGYGKYGTNPERSALGNSASGQMHQRTLEWLEQAQAQVAPNSSLAAPAAAPAKAPTPPVEEKEPDAKEVLKRKRLAAFKEASHVPNKLRVVEVEDAGRMLLEVPNIEPEVTAEDAKKKSKKAKKKVPPPPPPKPVEIEDTKGTGWVDNAFPWSLRASERAEGVRKEQSERLQWIERYLERESDESDVSEDEDADLPSPILPPATLERYDDDGQPPVTHNRPFRMGGTAGSGRFVVPSETTDARWQLTSLALRHRAARGRGEDDHDDGLGWDCVCGGRESSDLVQCDDCYRWYHMQCLDIKDVTELGDEDDPWYCHLCTGAPEPVPSRHRTPSPVPLYREPAFYTAQRTPLGFAVRPELVSFAPAFQDSPMPSWPSLLSAPALQPPTTPLYGRGGHSGSSTVHSSRSTATTLMSSVPRMPKTPRSAHGGRDVRVYSSSPDMFDEPFDLNATPTRLPLLTPRGRGWVTRANGVPWLTGDKATPDSYKTTSATFRALSAPGLDDSPVIHSSRPIR